MATNPQMGPAVGGWRFLPFWGLGFRARVSDLGFGARV